MISSNQISPDAPVVCSKNGQFAMVDHMVGSDTIKLKKDKQGQHHYIPLSWVTKVDDKVHIGRPGDQAMKEWSTSPKVKSAAVSGSDANKSKELSDKSTNDRATNEGMKNASSAEQKKMKEGEGQAPIIPSKGASGREGQTNKGNARSNH